MYILISYLLFSLLNVKAINVLFKLHSCNSLLIKSNLTIDSFNSFNLNYDSEIAQVSLESLKESIAKINLDNVDGLFVSCTALKIVDILDEVEKKFNTTVISSNQAIIWDCLQLLDMNVKIAGYGKLFNS